MNRRELFKGLAAALIAANIPVPFDVEETLGRSPMMDALPDMRIINYLYKVRLDLMYKISNPPVVMHEDGRIESLPTDVSVETLRHINIVLKDMGYA